MLAPGYPAEMPYFTRGLQRVGAHVIGLADQPESALPSVAASSLSAYIQVGSYSNEDAIVEQVRQSARHMRIDRVESQWEPLMLLAAKLREALGLPGMTVAETVPFRDKESMKRVLDQAAAPRGWINARPSSRCSTTSRIFTTSTTSSSTSCPA